MGLLIDISTLIDHERGQLDLATQLERRALEESFISVITASELLFGVYRTPDPRLRSRRSAVVEAILARFRALPVDAPVARSHAQLRAELSQRGTPVGPHDLWIAATAVAAGHVLVTSNVAEFARVPGLMVESWRPPG